jgi:hypothetical protein
MGENSIQDIFIGPFILCLEIGVIIILLHRLVFILKKSSPLKPLGQINRNLVGSIYGQDELKSVKLEILCLTSLETILKIDILLMSLIVNFQW